MEKDEFPLLVKGYVFKCFLQRGRYRKGAWEQADDGDEWVAVCRCGRGVHAISIDSAVDLVKQSYVIVRDNEHWHYEDTPRFNVILGTDGKWIMGTVTDWELVDELLQGKPMDLDDLKKEALSRGYTNIQRNAENAPVLPLNDWPGFSSHVLGGLYSAVTYYLEGNKVRVHKALEEGDHWYTLS